MEILQEHGLLAIEVSGEDPSARSYTFGILKNPPLLTLEQLSMLPKLLQESHQRLMERCEADRAKLHNLQASTGRGSKLLRGGSSNLLGGGGSKLLPKQNKSLTEQLQQNGSRPALHPVVVVSVPSVQEDLEPTPPASSSPDASALPDIPTRNNIPPSPSRGDTNAPAAPAPPIHCGPIFTPYTERIARELVPRYGADLVQQYVDWLEFQYRDGPPRKPLALLVSSLAKRSLLRPEGFKGQEELEDERREKARRQETARQEEERQRQEAQAHQRRLAQAQALFESLTEGEKEPYREQAALGMPEFLRSKRSFVESQAQWLFFEEKMRGAAGL